MQEESSQNYQANDQEMADKAMSWYGFGSPVGLGIMVLCIGAGALLFRLAVFGFG